MYDVFVVGAGPAGASAAMFTAKAGLKTLMLDSGQGVTRRAFMKNHYGASNITGPDLVETGKRQAVQLGAEVMDGKVSSLRKTDSGIELILDNGAHYEASQVLLCTGMWTDVAEQAGIQTQAGTEPRIKSIIVIDAQGKTSMPGVWAAGTAAGVSMHTIVTAGDGARVAINLISELKGARWVDHDVLPTEK
ncbi:FAD-binding protein [Alicyclobacillaceae bacterium I2511]|nr:FAD-binding protein [Alicyclobacillaceae bacterium I2511]